MNRHLIADSARHRQGNSDQSPSAPGLVTRFARDEASSMQRPDSHCETLWPHQSVGDAAQPCAIERPLKLLDGRLLHLLHLFKQWNNQVPNVFHFSHRKTMLQAWCASQKTSNNHFPNVLSCVAPLQTASDTTAIFTVEASGRFAGDVVWSLQHGVSSATFQFCCQSERDTTRKGDIRPWTTDPDHVRGKSRRQ